jgi:hypothetical protein
VKVIAIINVITLSILCIRRIFNIISYAYRDYLYHIPSFDYYGNELPKDEYFYFFDILSSLFFALIFYVPLIIFFIAFAMNYNNTKNKAEA